MAASERAGLQLILALRWWHEGKHETLERHLRIRALARCHVREVLCVMTQQHMDLLLALNFDDY
eukprot:754693-Hanusia_phi.AAC.2